jgi:phosphate:Na+ symporter
MKNLLVVMDFAGFVALLIWGVRMVQNGVIQAYGAQLRQMLGRALGNRFKAFLSGLGITALLQSSTATGLMMTSFAAGGYVELVPALAAMLGANVGTTLIVQVLSFDFTFAAPLLVLIGVVMFRRGQSSRVHDLGRVVIGLGLILFSLAQLLLLFARLEGSPFMHQLLELARQTPLSDLLLATLLAWAAHSSIAVVLVVMSLMAQGSLSPEAAFAMVLGANLGTAINPVLEGDTNHSGTARRVPLGNLFNRLLGCALILPFLEPASRWMAELESSPARVVADFHTAFNLVMALIFLPFLGYYARLLKRILPSRDLPDPGNPVYLDPRVVAQPSLALTAAAREALRMADEFEAMLASGMEALAGGDREKMGNIRFQGRTLEQLDHAIKDYLAKLDQEHMSREEAQRTFEILAFVSYLESAGDALDVDVMKPLAKQARDGLELSQQGEQEILLLMEQLVANTRLAASVFVARDVANARVLAATKTHFRDLEMALTQAHFKRLRSGRIDSHETSHLHLQLVHELKRINDYLVEGAAYPLLEEGVVDGLVDPA